MQLFKDVGTALPRRSCSAPTASPRSGFAAHIPASVAKRTIVTVATLAPDAYGAAATSLLARAPKQADPYFLYGYEAMKLITDAVAAGATTAPAVTAYLHTVNNRASVIGTYGFDANGDTTFKGYGLYGIAKRELRYVGEVTAP